MKELYLSQPEIIRKAERDFFVFFFSAVVASGILNGDMPSMKVVGSTLVASGSLALWRVVRGFVEPQPE